MIEALVSSLLGLLDIVRNSKSEQALKSKVARSLFKIFSDLDNIITTGKEILNDWESSREKIKHVVTELNPEKIDTFRPLYNNYIPHTFHENIWIQKDNIEKLYTHITKDFPNREIDIYLEDFVKIVYSNITRKDIHLSSFIELSGKISDSYPYRNAEYFFSDNYLKEAYGRLNKLEDTKNELREFMKNEYSLTDLIQ